MTTSETTVTTWSIDPVHSIVAFAVQHMAMSTFRGRFRTLEGTLQFDAANPAASSLTATIDASSIDVVGEGLFKAMAREDFFSIEQWPSMTFRSTRVEVQDATHWTVVGALTIRDATREVRLATTYLGQGTHPFSGKTVAAFHAEAQIDRGDFGLKWNAPLDTGAFYLGERVTITLDVEAVRQD